MNDYSAYKDKIYTADKNVIYMTRMQHVGFKWLHSVWVACNVLGIEIILSPHKV
jgi:hypothetical protein